MNGETGSISIHPFVRYVHKRKAQETQEEWPAERETAKFVGSPDPAPGATVQYSLYQSKGYAPCMRQVSAVSSPWHTQSVNHVLAPSRGINSAIYNTCNRLSVIHN